MPEPKRRRTAHKKSRPAASETEAPQSSSGPSAPFDEDSELVALRKTLQQVQEDLSVLQQDQRQVDDITRGIQHDRDEAQPRDTLHFLEEHFTCAL
jgi:small-conductance mechanosensitive channel